jgi:large subunit ribosomal protein L23
MSIAKLTSVLLAPVVTERSSYLQEKNKFTFEVRMDSNKGLIKQAVETLFDVKVLKVNIVKNRGKAKRFGSRLVHSSDKKKAIITLNPGVTIPIFDGV